MTEYVGVATCGAIAGAVMGSTLNAARTANRSFVSNIQERFPRYAIGVGSALLALYTTIDYFK